jgi:BirA family biotin operon repressor/biotin-[acetyl-CoA-carboxylase] ligase
MLSEATVVRALARAGIDAPARFDEVTTSTQATAVQLAREGAPEWTLVAAGHQTEGRGRLAREWIDEPGSALLFSFVLRPEGLDSADAGVLSLLAGSSMAEACSGVRKVGGVLASSEVSGGSLASVVVGVGVNVGAAPASVPDAGAVVGADPEDLLERFLIAFRGAYTPARASFANDVVEAYRSWCRTLGREVRVETGAGVVEGAAVDLDERGALVVETAAGRVAVGFGDVVHVDR